MIATPNEDTQFKDKVTKERNGKNYATGYISHLFVAINSTDWEAIMTLFCPLGFWVLLQSRLLEAIAKVS